MKLRHFLLGSVLSGVIGGAQAVPTYQSTWQGATFTVTQLSSIEFTFDILGSNALTGNWAGATYLGAFAFNDLGASASSTYTATLINPPPSQATNSTFGGLNANGCNGAGVGYVCFDLSPNVLVAPDLKFDILVTSGGPLNFSSLGPGLKIVWTNSPTLDAAIGDLYSQHIPPAGGGGGTGNGTVPEPETLALLGVGLLGAYVGTRRRR